MVLAATAVLALVPLQFLGERGVYAQGTVNFDPNPSENTPSTLGEVEDCVRVDVPPANFGDGTADVTMDIVVSGSPAPPGPIAYDAHLIYQPTDMNPVT